MSNNTPAGTLAEIWRFPVKSMLGERVESAALTNNGIVGDRAYALIDSETGKVVSAKSVRLYPQMFRCSARFITAPAAGQALPPVAITLGNGATVLSTSANVDVVLSEYFARPVTLANAAPDDFTIDMFHPDVDDATTPALQDTMVEQKLGAALFAELGAPSAVDAGSFFDVFPVTVLTTSTLRALAALRPESRFDPRRFRMNLIVDCQKSGFVENDWVGKRLTINGAPALLGAMPDARCVMTTLAQEDLPRDLDILRTLVQHNRIPVADIGKHPCAGLYATVAETGELAVGDPVYLD